MIGKLTGTLGHTSPGEALLDVAGVGYLVRVPLSVTLRAGDKLSLFIYTKVSDDAIDLYGFSTEAELAFFKQLMSVSGIGPKTALGIMGVSDVTTLKRSIAAGDASTLTKVFGIGKKSAERMVVELRDKVSLEVGGGTALHGVAGDDLEILEALMALGYRADESRAVLKTLSKSGATTLQERLGAALKRLGSPTRT
jgi:Holliday junction DNA helicase RuvA